MIFYVLLLPLALALTFFILDSNIATVYKPLLAFVPVPAVIVGIVSEFGDSNRETD